MLFLTKVYKLKIQVISLSFSQVHQIETFSDYNLF